MKTVIKNKKRWIYLTVEEAKERGFSPSDFRGACLSETMGPNWKDIWVIAGIPRTKKEK